MGKTKMRAAMHTRGVRRQKTDLKSATRGPWTLAEAIQVTSTSLLDRVRCAFEASEQMNRILAVFATEPSKELLVRSEMGAGTFEGGRENDDLDRVRAVAVLYGYVRTVTFPGDTHRRDAVLVTIEGAREVYAMCYALIECGIDGQPRLGSWELVVEAGLRFGKPN